MGRDLPVLEFETDQKTREPQLLVGASEGVFVNHFLLYYHKDISSSAVRKTVIPEIIQQLSLSLHKLTMKNNSPHSEWHSQRGKDEPKQAEHIFGE